ncbi:MAG TPA: LysR family transcriptional regulator [Candidatus Ventrimonas merdavium]|nr:LysR family transcriptional regulator [Candidatus Ventrimonas merdavium]
MEIRNLNTFTKVAEAGSLSGAARALGYAQSTVTMQMQQLEQELGAPLYERVGKKIRITQAGQSLLTYAVPIVRMSQEALLVGKEQSRVVDGSLRLGVLEVLAGEQMAARTNRYLQENPQVELALLTEPDSRSLANMLRHNEIDLMVTLDHPVSDADLVHAGEDIPEEIRFYAAKDHPLAGSHGVGLADILAYPLIRGDECLPYEQELEKLKEKKAARQIRVQNQDLALRMAVMQGGRGKEGGLAIAPESAAQEYTKDGRLTPLDYRIPGCRMWQQTIYHRNKWLTRAMNAWIAMEGPEAEETG